jgi:AcrR family transcriptional regulator
MAATKTGEIPDRPRTRASGLPADERRQAIVEAAVPLFVEHGEKVTTRQIAEAADVAEGTLFRAFPDKDAIVAAVVEHLRDPEPIDRAFAAIDPNQPLADVVEAAATVIQRRGQVVWRALARLGRPGGTAAPKRIPESAPLAALFEPHAAELRVEPKVAAQRLRALTLAMSHPMLAERPASAADVAAMFLHGAGREGSC